jgi:hypothetical protein
VSGLGAITRRGDFMGQGSAASIPIASLMVGAAPNPKGSGYSLVASDGGVFSFGDAPFRGSTGAAPAYLTGSGPGPDPDSTGLLARRGQR